MQPKNAKNCVFERECQTYFEIIAIGIEIIIKKIRISTIIKNRLMIIFNIHLTNESIFT